MNYTPIQVINNSVIIPREYLPVADSYQIEVDDKSVTVRANRQLDWVEEDSDSPERREREAYIALHPMLWEKYPKQFVAIYGGKLIDHHREFAPLWRRICEQYPDEYVWVSQVEEKPIRTIQMRTGRFF